MGLITVITAALFIAPGCDGTRAAKGLPLSADVSLPSREIWTRFMWERFAASPSTAAFNASHAAKEPRRSWAGHGSVQLGAKQQMDFKQQTYLQCSGSSDLYGKQQHGAAPPTRSRLSPPQNLIRGTTNACLLAKHQLSLLL